MMTRQHWMTQTKRGLFTPRSKKLEAIDDAFEAYELAVRSRQGTTRASTHLFNTVIEWIKSKGSSWKSSTRNSRIEPGGKGTVETLLNDLLGLNPVFRAQAAPYLSQSAPPPPPLMQYGAKNRQKDVDGGWHEIPVQTQENSCGPCSIRMVIKLVTNQDVGEEYLRELVEMVEEGGAYGGSLGRGGVLQRGGAHDWSPTGGGTWLIPAALDAVRPPIKTSHGADPSVLLQTSKKKPAIGVVKWANGALHYVVAAGRSHDGTKLIILDPYYGVQAAPVVANALGDYCPTNPSNGATLARATWFNWVCKVE
jgi:hypothetical protein